MIKKTSSNQSYGRDRECKMVRFYSPSLYIIRKNVYKNSNSCYTSLFIIYFHRNRISLGAYLTYLASQDNFSWVPHCPKNNLFGLCENA